MAGYNKPSFMDVQNKGKAQKQQLKPGSSLSHIGAELCTNFWEGIQERY